MPNTLLTIPHFQQQQNADCLSACAMMVLTHLGFQVAYDTILRRLYVHDPAFAAAPIAIPLTAFELAWMDFDYRYAVLTRA